MNLKKKKMSLDKNAKIYIAGHHGLVQNLANTYF